MLSSQCFARRRSLQQWTNSGFPWCKCKNRDPSLSPVKVTYTGVQTTSCTEKGTARYACFALSVDSSYKADCAECSNMVVGKLEFHLSE